MKKYIYSLLVLVTVLFTSCSPKSTLVQQYPKMYEESPLTIAVMPPINKTTHVEAKDFFYTTMYMPLCERGYYVFSPYLTLEMFQGESAYDSEQFIDADLGMFRNVLNADALVFTIIKDWRRSNIGAALRVQVEYIIRSTKTGETLYKREGTITVDMSSGVGGVLGFVADAIATAATDKVIAGRKCTTLVLSDLPAGKYHPQYGNDQNKKAGKPVFKAVVKD